MPHTFTAVYLSLGVITFLGSLGARMVQARAGRPARWLPGSLGLVGAALLAAAIGLDGRLLPVVGTLAPAALIMGLILSRMPR